MVHGLESAGDEDFEMFFRQQPCFPKALSQCTDNGAADEQPCVTQLAPVLGVVGLALSKAGAPELYASDTAVWESRSADMPFLAVATR